MCFKQKVVDRLARIEGKLDLIITGLATQATQETKTQMTIEELQAQVDKNRDLEESAVTLINGLATQFAAAKNDPVKIQALADELTKSGSDLAGAITNNTPLAPPPPPAAPGA